MASKRMYNEPVGVIGAGSFGTVVANLLARNATVLLYARRAEVVHDMQLARTAAGQPLASNIQVVSQLSEITQRCQVLFPVVPSGAFREVIKQLAPLLQSHHLLIHGTKGLVARWPSSSNSGPLPMLRRADIQTMSELIQEESVVRQVGCLAGPNLASEIAQGQPAATVIASSTPAVIEAGQKLLQGDRFRVYGSTDLIGTELCGALKNIMAIGIGCMGGLGFGENAKAFVMSRGLDEIVQIGCAMGGTAPSFLGLAGIGDLVATCASKLSRNYTVGYRLAQGQSYDQVVQHAQSTAEGIATTKIVRGIIEEYGLQAPITEAIYRILFEGVAARVVIEGIL